MVALVIEEGETPKTANQRQIAPSGAGDRLRHRDNGRRQLGLFVVEQEPERAHGWPAFGYVSARSWSFPIEAGGEESASPQIALVQRSRSPGSRCSRVSRLPSSRVSVWPIGRPGSGTSATIGLPGAGELAFLGLAHQSQARPASVLGRASQQDARRRASSNNGDLAADRMRYPSDRVRPPRR